MDADNKLICAFDISRKTGNAKSLNLNTVSKAISKTYWRWVHLDRTHNDVEKFLLEQLGVPELAVNALLAEETRPRVQEMETGYIVNLRGVNLNPNASPEDMVAIRFWLENNRIVSLRRFNILAMHDIRTDYENGSGPASIGDFLAKATNSLAERMSLIILDLDDVLDELEDKAQDDPTLEDRNRLANARRQAISLKRFLSPQREALSKLANLDVKWLDADHKLRIREAYDNTSRMVETLDAIRERAGVLQEEFSSYLAERDNRNTYLLTVIAAIFLPLGFLTGLLGVNVGGIPGIENPYAFLWVTLAMIIIGLLEYILFKYLKWL